MYGSTAINIASTRNSAKGYKNLVENSLLYTSTLNKGFWPDRSSDQITAE